jgi:hypothetical protein
MFERGKFESHSGIQLNWKIECDGLTDADLEALAEAVSSRIIFKEVIGIPRGGLRFAEALKQYRSPVARPTLIVDDVLTTGRSMNELRKSVSGPSTGVVIFARGPGPIPAWIFPIFSLATWICP